MVGIGGAASRNHPPGVAGDGFAFLDHPPLIDRELRLVPPGGEDWIDQLLAACHHPSTEAQDPESAQVTREDLLDFLARAPGGREPGDFASGRVPCYHFSMHVLPEFNPPLPIAGGIGLRLGSARELELYFGHIGYAVFPAMRGHHYAERSCRLLFSLARRHGLNPLWITTDPENIASRRTCERLGGKLINTVEIPKTNILYARGQRQKCRYRVDL